MKKKDVVINIPYMEIIDKIDHSKVRYNNVNFRLLKNLDLKFGFGIFTPKKKYFNEEGEKVEEVTEK